MSRCVIIDIVFIIPGAACILYQYEQQPTTTAAHISTLATTAAAAARAAVHSIYNQQSASGDTIINEGKCEEAS